MAAFGICYISTDGRSVAAMKAFEAEDLAEALTVVRADPEQYILREHCNIQIWSSRRLVFCGDPDKFERWDLPTLRCSSNDGAPQLFG